MGMNLLKIKLTVIFALFFTLLGFSFSNQVSTVAQVKKNARNTDVVTVVGRIIKIRDVDSMPEEFVFADETGSVRMDIDEDLWYGLGVSRASQFLNKRLKVIAVVDDGIFSFMELKVLEVQLAE